MKIRSVPYQKGPDKQPILIELDKSLFSSSIDRDQSFLIEEAIRFYNYGISTKPGIVYKKPDLWKPITAKRLHDAIHELRDGYHNSFKQSIKGLTNKQELLRHIPDTLIKDLTKDDRHGYHTLFDNANRGIFAVRTFLNREWRSTRLNYNGKKNKARCRMLDQAIDRLDDIRWVASVKNVTEMIQEQFGDSGNVNLLQPIWGGTKVIEPDWSKKPAKDAAKDGNWYENLYGNGEKIRLSEKLYIMLASEVFRAAHNLWRSTYTGRKGEGCGLLEIIEYKVEQYQNEVLPFGLMEKKYVWKTWFSNLDLLSYRFGHAVRIRNEMDSELGLPWALALIGVLKVYLLDTMVRTMMLSLPVKQVYDDVSGNGGVCLLEALVPNSAQGPSIDGCIDVKWDWRLKEDGGPSNIINQSKQYYDPRLSGALSKWLKYIPIDPWNGRFELHQMVTHLFKDLAATPLLVKPSQKKRKGRVPAKSLSISVFKNNIYRFPVVERDFYTEFGMRRSLQNDLNFGIRYIVQAHLYVACILLKEAKKIVGVDQLDWRNGENFTFGDGCFLWGGKCPPHITHKDGRRVDLNYGPHIVPWPVVKIKEELEWFNEFFDVDKKTRKRHKTLLSVCNTNEQVAEVEKAISPKNVVFREMISELIYQHVNELRRHARKNPQNFDSKETAKYENAENELIGTPHFYHVPDELPKKKQYNTRTVQDWKMTHIGHLAILLSAPHHIVFASPIIHLRAMHIIRKVLASHKDLLKAGSKIVGQTFFAFLPQDHHHHWHVEYLNPVEKDNLQVTINDFKEYTELWLAMGIDFRPFHLYLGKMRSSSQEFQELDKALDEYIEQYMSIYYPDGKKNQTAFADAEKLLEDLFILFNDTTSPFLKPTIVKKGGGFVRSSQVRQNMTNSVKYVANVINYYQIKKEIERLTLNSYGYDELNIPIEYIDIWGLENADELIGEEPEAKE